jgi:hypothetical protein
MKKLLPLLGACAILLGSLNAEDKEEFMSKFVEIKPLPPAANEVLFGARIQRTMTLLSTSNEKVKRNVKILFYGQSIVAGMHWEDIIEELRKRYPYANIISENRAIGGFTAPKLVRPALHDLYPYYPDLVIFHVYTANYGEWERIISNVRRYTTAEIMIYTHQVANGGENHETRTKNDDIDSDMIRYIAQKYNCELVEVRKEWKNYLEVNKLKANELMGDKVHRNVHPNQEGHTLLAQMILRHFRENTLFPGGWYNTIRTYEARRAVEEKSDEITFSGTPWKTSKYGITGNSKDSALKLKFTGNRIDVTSFNSGGKLGTAKILVDGKAPSSFPALYYCTRPSNAHKVWWPAVNRVSISKDARPEKWTLTITSVSEDGKDIEFDLEGSVTGKDGKGSNKGTFVSNSGKITIEPQDLSSISSAQKYKKTKCPENYKVTWEIKPAFTDVWKPQNLEDKAQENTYTLFQGLENKEHTLEIIPNGDGNIPVKSITVHTPPLK